MADPDAISVFDDVAFRIKFRVDRSNLLNPLRDDSVCDASNDALWSSIA